MNIGKCMILLMELKKKSIEMKKSPVFKIDIYFLDR
jgi:hypothetical protein